MVKLHRRRVVNIKWRRVVNLTGKSNKLLIVFQGANDVRVLPIESDEIVAGVKKNGVPVEYVVFPDEGHGFVKKENQITTAKRTLEFLDKYLKPGNK